MKKWLKYIIPGDDLNDDAVNNIIKVKNDNPMKSQDDNNIAYIVIGAIIAVIIAYNLGASSSTYSSEADESDELTQCISDLDEANIEVSNLQTCVKEFKLNLSSIALLASRGSWESYNTMGDTIDDITNLTSDYNICDY